MGIMSSFYIGTGSLQTSQNALNTVSHNLSNVETPGYTRQQVLISDRKMGTNQFGSNYCECRQVRDAFLDKSTREKVSELNYYEEMTKAINYVQDLFGSEDGYKTSIENLWVSLQEIKKSDDAASIEVFNQRLNEFNEYSKTIKKSLDSYINQINKEKEVVIEKVNEISKQIAKLNKDIKKIEITKENANDLKDNKNNLLDELSKYGLVEVDLLNDNRIRFNGELVVDGTQNFEFISSYQTTNGTLNAFNTLTSDKMDFSLVKTENSFVNEYENLFNTLNDFNNLLSHVNYERIQETVDNVCEKVMKSINKFDDFMEEVANYGSFYDTQKTTCESCLESANNLRNQLLNVSSDEELTFLMKFQNAYNASSRYINVLNDMLDTLLNI